MATLRVRLQGDLGNITHEALLSALRDTQAILIELDTAISGRKGGTLDWVVAGLREGSAELAISPRSRVLDHDYWPEVVSTYVDSIARLEHQVAGLFQNGSDEFAARSFIVRHQHSLHNVCSSGMVNVTRVPLPGSLLSEMLPQCCSTSRFVMARPSPVPSLAP